MTHQNNVALLLSLSLLVVAARLSLSRADIAPNYFPVSA